MVIIFDILEGQHSCWRVSMVSPPAEAFLEVIVTSRLEERKRPDCSAWTEAWDRQIPSTSRRGRVESF